MAGGDKAAVEGTCIHPWFSRGGDGGTCRRGAFSHRMDKGEQDRMGRDKANGGTLTLTVAGLAQ